MKKKPSLDEFRSGGGEAPPPDGVPAAAVPAVPDAAVPATDERVNKTIRIRKSFEKKLKEDAFHRTMTEGRRVAESDIIDEALEKYYSDK